MKGIPIGQLDKETLKKLGMDGIDSQVVALSHVLDSVRNVQKDDAIWALKKALEMLDSSPKQPKQEPVNFTDFVISRISEYFGFLPQDLLARGRSSELVVARQVAMYVLWRSDKYTLDVIGKSLGGRSPATVSWGAQQVHKALNSKPKIKSVVEELLALQ